MGDGQRLIEAAREAAKRCTSSEEISALPENDQVTAWAHSEVRYLLSAILNQCTAMEAGAPDAKAFNAEVMDRMLDYGQSEALTVFNCALFWLAGIYKKAEVGDEGTYAQLAELAVSGQLMDPNDPLYRLFKEEK